MNLIFLTYIKIILTIIKKYRYPKRLNSKVIRNNARKQHDKRSSVKREQLWHSDSEVKISLTSWLEYIHLRFQLTSLEIKLDLGLTSTTTRCRTSKKTFYRRTG